MFEQSQGDLFSTIAENSTQSLPASPASPPVARAEDSAPMTIAGSGLSICAWCLKSTTRSKGRSCGCWRRTLMTCLASQLRVAASAIGLRLSFKVSAIHSSLGNLALTALARHTNGNESGLWPTATASTGGQNATAPTNHEVNGKHGTNLKGAVKNWATPQARDFRDPDKPDSANYQRKQAKKYTIDLNSQVAAVRKVGSRPWPTPKASDYKRGKSPADMARKSPCLPSMVHINGQQDRDNFSINGKSPEKSQTPKLNPRWVLQIMGAPPDWLDVGETELLRLLEMERSSPRRKR